MTDGLILIVENEPLLQPMIQVCGRALPGVSVESSPATASAQHHIRTMDYTVIVTPVLTPQVDGLTILREATRLQPRTPVILIANPQEWHASSGTNLMAGAYDVLMRPLDADMLCMALRRAADTYALRWEDHPALKEDCVVIVRGLSHTATVELVKLLFAPVGKVVWCRLVAETNSPAFAFVEVESGAVAQQAVNQLSGRTVFGFPLTLSTCRGHMERRPH